jgi:hypothetical protein
MPAIRLLATDLEGTLIGSTADFHLLPKSHLIMKPLDLIIQLVEFISPI